MSKIFVNDKGFVDVNEDDYTRGEGDHVNSWDFDIRGQYDSINDLLNALNKELYWDIKLDDVYFLDGYLQGSAEVDVNNELADERDFEAFKNGEVDWYIASFWVPLKIGDIHDMTEEEAESFGIPIY